MEGLVLPCSGPAQLSLEAIGEGRDTEQWRRETQEQRHEWIRRGRGAADEERAGRQHAANPNSPACLSPAFNPQKFPSASGALGTQARKGRSLSKANRPPCAQRFPVLCGPQLKGRVRHFVDEALQDRQGPTCTPGLQWVSMEKALAVLAGLTGKDLLDTPAIR